MNVTTPIMLDGYVQWVQPWRAHLGIPVYLLGDHGYCCPVMFGA